MVPSLSDAAPVVVQPARATAVAAVATSAVIRMAVLFIENLSLLHRRRWNSARIPHSRLDVNS